MYDEYAKDDLVCSFFGHRDIVVTEELKREFMR